MTVELSKKHLRDLFGGNIPTAQVLQGIAAGLADCGVKVIIDPRIKCPQASPDEKKIYLPAHVKSEKALLIVSWHLDHETGHLIYSPNIKPLLEQWQKGCRTLEVIKDKGYPPELPTEIVNAMTLFWNFIEDPRIEKLMLRRFPGSKKHFIGGPVAAGLDNMVGDYIQKKLDQQAQTGAPELDISAFWAGQMHAYYLLDGTHGQRGRFYARESLLKVAPHLAPILDIVEDEIGHYTDAGKIPSEEAIEKADACIARILELVLPDASQVPPPQSGPGQSDPNGQPNPNGQGEGEAGEGEAEGDESETGEGSSSSPEGRQEKKESGEDQDSSGSESESNDADGGSEEDEANSSSGGDDADPESEDGGSGQGSSGSDGEDSDDESEEGGESSGEGKDGDSDGDVDDEDDDEDSDDVSNGDAGGSGAGGGSEGEGKEGGDDAGSGDSDSADDPADSDKSDGEDDADGESESEDSAEAEEGVDQGNETGQIPQIIKDWVKDAGADIAEMIRESMEKSGEEGEGADGSNDGNVAGSPSNMPHASDMAGMPEEYFEKIMPGVRDIVIQGADLQSLINGGGTTFHEYDVAIRNLMPKNLGPAGRAFMGKFKAAPGRAYVGSRVNPRMLQPIKAGTAAGRPLFLARNESTRSRKGVAVMLGIDCSGSMCSGIPGLNTTSTWNSKYAVAHAAARSLARLLQMVQVPFSVFGFTTSDTSYEYRSSDYTNRYGASRRVDIVNLLFKDFHEPWGSSELQMLAMNPTTRLTYKDKHIRPHTNSDGESIIWAATRLLPRDEDRKIMIIISDGLPWAGDAALQSKFLKWAVHRIEIAGIRIGGLGLGDEGVKHYYRVHEIIDAFPPGLGEDLTAPLYIQDALLRLIDKLAD